MTFDRYAQWLARGRDHQAGLRMIDALLCYRRALREAPLGIDAQFHIGEIAWSMGNEADAIAAWRAASAQLPTHYASWHALADALADHQCGKRGAEEGGQRRVEGRHHGHHGSGSG